MLYEHSQSHASAFYDVPQSPFDEAGIDVSSSAPRITRGSIEILLILSAVLTGITKYNELFAAIETAFQNTRRVAERLSDAYLQSVSGGKAAARIGGSWAVSPRVVKHIEGLREFEDVQVSRTTSIPPSSPSLTKASRVKW